MTPPYTSPVERRIVRLTHLQWDLTTADLLHLPRPSGLSERFLSDPATSRFDNAPGTLALNPTLFQQYQSAAEELARRVVEDPSLYTANVPDGIERDAWIAQFGKAAYRRDLTDPEVSEYRALFDEGESIFDSGDDFADGVRACIAAALQSPHFLHRVENGRPDAESTLSAPALAQKLSFTLWNTMPDADLWDAADRGLEPTEVEAEVRRMLEDDKGRAMVSDLHGQWMHVENYPTIYRPSTEVLTTDFEATLTAAMMREAHLFVGATVDSGGTLADLLTSTDGHVTDRLAEIYGVTGAEAATGTDHVVVSLPADQRAGILTTSGFLAYHAGRYEASPIRRGAFVADSLLCLDVPGPPPSATAVPSDGSGTLRERVQAHTGACGGSCHEILNPVGFAFGHYDQAGEYREREDGQVIDATGTLELDGQTVSFDGAVELAAHLSASRQVHRCYAEHLLAYLQQRPVHAGDEARLEALATASLSGRPIRDLMTDIVTDPAFLQIERTEQ